MAALKKNVTDTDTDSNTECPSLWMSKTERGIGIDQGSNWLLKYDVLWPVCAINRKQI